MGDVTEAALTTGSWADINNADTKTSLLQIGDYWVVYLLSKNLPPVAMKVSCHVSRITLLLSRVTNNVADAARVQELLNELKPVLNPSRSYGNSTGPGAYPQLDNLDKEFEKESNM